MKPEQIAKAGTEHAHQTAFFCWASQYPELEWMFAIPNGGLRDRITAGNMKAEGVKAGICDVMLPLPVGRYHGLFVEMKVKANKPSPKQERFIAYAISVGYAVRVCYSWLEAKDTVTQYMKGEM